MMHSFSTFSIRLFAFISMNLFCQLALFAQNQPTNEDGWVLRREEDGLKIYTRPRADNPVDEYKGVVTVLGNIDSAFTIVSNIDRFSSTDPYIKRTDILQKASDNDQYIYQIINMPFFLKDRDLVARVRSSKTATGYIIVAEGEPKFFPENPEFIRVEQVNVLVALRKVGTNSFEITYKGSLTLSGGDIVANFMNKAIVGSTFDRLVNIREIVTPPATAQRK